MEKNIFNPQQLKAVRQNGSLAVIAGPGTGKTYTLVGKLRYLLDKKKVNPSNILVLTFMKKAAEEMSQRIFKINGSHLQRSGNINPNGLFIGTIHSWCFWVLRNFSSDWKQKNLTIISGSERKDIVRGLLKGHANWRSVVSDIDSMVNILSKMKSRTIRNKDKAFENNVVEELLVEYQDYLFQKGLIDFDDLLLKVRELFNQGWVFPKKYEYVLVDEFQDLNRVQYEIVSFFVRHGSGLFAVGDPYQSIYAFRGADNKLFDRLKKDFGFAEIRLIENYRSSQKILDLADSLFVPRRGLKSRLNTYAKLIHTRTFNHKTEAYWIAKEILKLTGTGEDLDYQTVVNSGDNLSFGQIAILCRLKSLMPEIEKQLSKANIPYQVVGRKTLLDFREIRQVSNLISELKEWRGNFGSCSTSLMKLLTLLGVSPSVKGRNELIYSKIKLKMIDVVEASIKVCQIQIRNSAVKARVDKLLMLGYSFATAGTIRKLPIEDFLFSLKEYSEVDGYDSNFDKVSLSTIHGAKGLEFEAVFIPGLEEEVFPCSKSFDDVDLIEEERRLLYVGMTRAKYYLYLSSAKFRSYYGEYQSMQPSRFLNELETDLLSVQGDPYVDKYVKAIEKRKNKKMQMKLF